MSENVCPYPAVCPEDCAPNRRAIEMDREIARLKAALARSESAFRGMVEIKDEISAERDDARRWARKFYRAYLDLAVGYDNSWDV